VRAQKLREALKNLEAQASGAVNLGGDLDFPSVAHQLVSLEHGKAVAQLVGSPELVGTEKYENLDPGWIECLLEYATSRPVDFPCAPTDGAIYPLADVTGASPFKIALAGDWGTKNDPAIRVQSHIAEMSPDYTIHLGDIYYAGLPVDEKAFLLNLWPNGKAGTFALNSNHEMYCGGKGYFETIRDSKFGNRGFSYFALHNDHWLIVGLDTAYFAYKRSLLYEDGYLADPDMGSKGKVQTDWLTNVLQMPQHQNKRSIILTHHDAFDVSRGTAKKKALYNELLSYVGTNRDFFWYWGHVHGGIAYRPVRLSGASRVFARCVGHGGVPYAPYPVLTSLGNAEISVDWAERELAGTGDPNRALNGYMLLTLDGPNIREEFYDEKGRQRWHS